MKIIDLTKNLFCPSDSLFRLSIGLKHGINSMFCITLNRLDNTLFVKDDLQKENEEYIKLLKYLKEETNKNVRILEALQHAIERNIITTGHGWTIDSYLTEVVNDIFENQINCTIKVDSLFGDLIELKSIQSDTISSALKYVSNFLTKQIELLPVYETLETNYYQCDEEDDIAQYLDERPVLSSFNFLTKQKLAITSDIFNLKEKLTNNLYTTIQPSDEVYNRLIEYFQDTEQYEHIYVDIFTVKGITNAKYRIYKLLDGSLKVIRSTTY